MEREVSLYRGGMAQNLGPNGQIRSITSGRLYRLEDDVTDDGNTYGFACSDELFTGAALDVVKQPGLTPKLRIFLVQFDPAGAGTGGDDQPRLAVAIMDNLLFSPRKPEALRRAGPLTADILKALTN